VFAYAQAEGLELRLDATEIQVRRPLAGRGGRRAFVSGKKKQNTMKATVIADRRGRTLWTDALRPGRMHDATADRSEGIADCFQSFFALLQKNVLDRRVWATRQELRIAIVTWIERTYQRRRRQRRLGRLTPVEYETIMTPPAALAA
ncbi:transposase family protein, partial [Streptomyces sp. NPDC059680]|uniref:transposase family protein n=1 Tax=Streptomyces sp. NPDC059680 TaxID=3346904 RepID=UPI0036945C48